MANNKDLFKQAIAEAKSIREAAITNAKEALEETLTPHLKDMLAAKLQEMEDNSDERLHDEPNEELKFEEEGEEEMDMDTDDDSEESEEEVEDIEVKDMEVVDLKDLIRDIIAQEMGAEEAGEELPGEELPTDDMVGAEDEEEIDLDELLREISEMSNEEDLAEYDSMTMEEPSDAAAAGMDSIMKGLKDLIRKGGPIARKAKDALEALGSAAGSAMRNEEEVAEYGSSSMKEPSDAAAAGMDNIIKGLQAVVRKGGPIAKKAYAALQDLGAAAGSAIRNEGEHSNEEDSSEMEEALSTVQELRAQLQEVNLLNAKLLYVNKVFKANNLTESQKVNVIAAFDKAETVKEVKLVFETVADNVGNNTSKSTIKEARLGMASKATGMTARKPQVISEVSDAVKRMQKLAGIIK